MAAPKTHATSSNNASTTIRQHDQLRRFLYPSLISTDNLPLLLPLSQIQQNDAAWIKLDLECQLLLAQVLRIAIQPWYSKLTNDRQLYEEIILVVSYGLHKIKEALLQRSSNVTRLERLLLHDVPILLQLHYTEVRRAIAICHRHKDEHEKVTSSASIFLASNPHPALSFSAERQLQIDEAYIDLLLLAILQGILPSDHLASHNETLIIIDIIKGVFRSQIRLHGSGAWVVVRAIHSLLDFRSAKELEHTFLPVKSQAACLDYRSILISGLSLIYRVIKYLFLYLAVFYLDLFTPAAEPKKRTKRRKGATETDLSSGWDLNTLLDVIVEALNWRYRISTRFMEGWLRIGLAWGGTRLVERQIKDNFVKRTQPEQMRQVVAQLHEMVADMPNQPAPEPIMEPSLAIQKKEYDQLITKLLNKVQAFAPFALLVGHDEATQKQAIGEVLSPFFEPPIDIETTSAAPVANARLLLCLLERCAMLVNPTLH